MTATESSDAAAGRRLDGRRTRPVKLAHVVLRVREFDDTVQWYARVLNAKVVFDNPMIAFLTYDEEHHRLAVLNFPHGEPVTPTSCGLEHVAFTYRSLGDLLENYVRLRSDGIEPYWCINHGPTHSMYYRDPAGNQVELQVDNFDDVTALLDWYRAGSFRTNPIGVNFDPDALIARYQSGETEASILRPPD